MKPICFIAARGGSKGVPKKNIRVIEGKPLIAHTIVKAIKSGIFSHVVVSTEDSEIAAIAKKYGAELPFRRPKKLAEDKTGGDEVLRHGIKKLYSLGYDFNIVVLLDCTVPFIRIQDIKASISMAKKKKCDIVAGVYRQHLNPYYNIVELKNGFLKLVKLPKKEFRTRQESPKVYQLNGLYTVNAKKFLKHGFDLSNTIPYEIPIETGVMIDTEFEFQIAKQMFKYLSKQ